MFVWTIFFLLGLLLIYFDFCHVGVFVFLDSFCFVLVFFLLLFCFERERGKNNMKLGRWAGGEDLGGIGREEKNYQNILHKIFYFQ